MTTLEDTINIRDLAKFPRPVAEVITEAINQHGVKYRLTDGGHIRLFDGNRQTVPCKVAAVRDHEDALRYLLPWLDQHVPTWSEREITPDNLRALAEAKTSEPKPVKAKPVIERGPDGKNWKDYKYGFETDGKKNYRCKTCGWLRSGNAGGIHLHRCARTPEAIQARSSRGGKAAGLKRQQQIVMRRQAARVIAEQNGLVVFEKDEVGSQKEVKELRAKNQELQTKVDDLQARVDLLNEAFRGLT